MWDNYSQETLDKHVKECTQCQKARNLFECCKTGRVLAQILAGKA